MKCYCGQEIDVPHAECRQLRAEATYPDHAPSTALANYEAGREVWDTNGDMW